MMMPTRAGDGSAMGGLYARHLALHPLNGGLDQLLYLPEPGLGPGLEAEHQQRLGVAGADEAPAVGEGDPDSVHVDDRVAGGAEDLGGPLHHRELLLLRHVEADLGAGEGARHVGQQLRQRPLLVGEDLQQPCRAVHRVVEAEVAVLEEDVAAHLPGQLGVGLLHLRLDQAVPRLPHHRRAAVGGDVVVERGRALHLTDDRRSGDLGQHRAGEEDHQLIPPEHLALVVDDADPIGVTVVGDPHLGLLLLHRGDEVLEVLQHRRVRVVVGEPGVHLAEEGHHVEAHRTQQRHRHLAPGAVAGVDHHPHPLSADLAPSAGRSGRRE